MPSFSCGAAGGVEVRSGNAGCVSRAALCARETQTKGARVKSPPRPPLWPHGRPVKNREGEIKQTHVAQILLHSSYRPSGSALTSMSLGIARRVRGPSRADAGCQAPEPQVVTLVRIPDEDPIRP